ncbi:MAG: tetratricopeptide repeat protein [Planctomycetaceae bacterium]|nr:tetratricopeptide repeat protein [Planctomycetaceae bacterium]
MQNHNRIFFGVLLFSTILLAITGCKSMSSDSGHWFTPNVRGQAPAWNGNTNPDAFSSTQVVAVPATPVSVPTNVVPSNPFAPNSDARPATLPEQLAQPVYRQVPPPVSDPFLVALPAESTPSTFSATVPNPAIMNPAIPNPAIPNPTVLNPAVPNPAVPSSVPSGLDVPLTNDLWTSKVAATSQPVVQSHPWDLPAGHVHAEPIPTTVSPISDPWGLGNPTDLQNAVSIEQQAKYEEDELEKARLEELATARHQKIMPEYLKPLPKWNGPFESREQKQTIEQDIIRQVGYSEEKPKSFDALPVYDWEKEEQKGFDWSVLDPVNFFTKVRDWVGLGPDETKANAAMKKGRELLLATPDLKDRKKCLEAAKLFSEAAKRWPDSLLEEDALHLAGECYFFGEDYTRAMRSYQKLLIKYQHSKHIDNGVRRLFMIARYWELEDRRGVSSVNITEKSRPTFDTFGYAKKAYETIFINDPNGPISDDAVMALATAYLLKGRYKGDDNYNHAAYYYNFLRENYPLSKHITRAHELELEARTNAYMGAEHSGTTLDEAQKLADITLRQFSSELGEGEKEEILEMKEGIIQRQAEREWTMGQFYDKKQYYGSAKLYYEKLLDKYPQTEYAEKARVRLEQIQNKPDQPDQLDFLKKIFRPRGT